MTVSAAEKERYLAMKGQGGSRILHIEHWSNPDAETYMTGIDYYDRPRDCRLRMKELYPMLNLPIPATNEPLPRPKLDGNHVSSNTEHHSVRWGAGETDTFLHGEQFFRTEDDVFAFHPLQHADFRDWKFVVENKDYTSEDIIYEQVRKYFPAEWGDKAPAFSTAEAGFYNTMFMWPLLTFGWEMFLATCLEDEFEPVMAEFAEINRRVFRAYSRLPIHFCTCHDDICMTAGPVCSPAWMHKYIYPRYEEYWSILKEKGIDPIFMTDGNPTDVLEEILRCGARGLITEPYFDFTSAAKKHPDILLAGEGDNRILTYGTKEDIRRMVERMVANGKECGGYFMCIGNHIPWNVPGRNIQYYLEYSDQLAWR